MGASTDPGTDTINVANASAPPVLLQKFLGGDSAITFHNPQYCSMGNEAWSPDGSEIACGLYDDESGQTTQAPLCASSTHGSILQALLVFSSTPASTTFNPVNADLLNAACNYYSLGYPGKRPSSLATKPVSPSRSTHRVAVMRSSNSDGAVRHRRLARLIQLASIQVNTGFPLCRQYLLWVGGV